MGDNPHYPNDPDLDQADEEILTTTVSDEDLEAAAGTERGANTAVAATHPDPCCGWSTANDPTC